MLYRHRDPKPNEYGCLASGTYSSISPVLAMLSSRGVNLQAMEDLPKSSGWWFRNWVLFSYALGAGMYLTSGIGAFL